MEKGLHNFDHRADFIDRRSPPAVSGCTTGVHQDPKSLSFVATYAAVGMETI